MPNGARTRRRYVLLAVGAVVIVVVAVLALLWAITPVKRVESFPVTANCSSVVKSFPATVTITWIVPDQVPMGSGAYYANTSWDAGTEYDVHAVSQNPGASYGTVGGVTSPATFSACPVQGAPVVILTVQAVYWTNPV